MYYNTELFFLPALFTKISTGPTVSTILANMAWTSSALPMLAFIGIPTAPLSPALVLISSQTSLAAVSLLAV